VQPPERAISGGVHEVCRHALLMHAPLCVSAMLARGKIHSPHSACVIAANLNTWQDNFTVFMTLIRAMLIGFCGMEMGFAVTSKDVTFDLKVSLIFYSVVRQLR
jgi:hypothetical protein